MRRFKKSTKKAPRRTKTPNGQQKYPEKRVFDNRKNGFLVL
jgi:hypothetical protein